MTFEEMGIRAPSLLLPAADVPTATWAVVACDQYTSQPEYWARVDALVGEKPSTLRMMLPEAWLGREDAAQLEKAGPETMERYLEQGILMEAGTGFVLTERQLKHGTRWGLMAAFDLEQYDYSPHSTTPIRATEATVVSRIPPRVRIREKASLEMPHILMLMDDPEDRFFGALREAVHGKVPLYEAELMEQGGSLRGYRVPREAEARLASILASVTDGCVGGIRFAMGDGNHSLAAAKACWEKKKVLLTEEERENHPARFALAELVNLWQPALTMEPIHRVLHSTDAEALLARLLQRLPVGDQGVPITFLTGGEEHSVRLALAEGILPLTALQPAIDEVLSAEETQDYIHGESALRALSCPAGSLGILLPPIDKGALFSTVKALGPLPRKCFSLGEAEEKRYYFELRRII